MVDTFVPDILGQAPINGRKIEKMFCRHSIYLFYIIKKIYRKYVLSHEKKLTVHSSHKGKGDARHMIDMVWLYLSPIPVRRRGILFVQMFSTCLRGAQRKGGGESVPCNVDLFYFNMKSGCEGARPQNARYGGLPLLTCENAA